MEHPGAGGGRTEEKWNWVRPSLEMGTQSEQACEAAHSGQCDPQPGALETGGPQGGGSVSPSLQPESGLIHWGNGYLEGKVVSL